MQITHNVTGVNKTADDWELFDMPGRDDCALRLNNKYMELVNAGGTRESVQSDMEKFMDAPGQGEFGAGDSEGYYMVERLNRTVFGK